MKFVKFIELLFVLLLIAMGCNDQNNAERDSKQKIKKEVTAKEILGNPDYQAISYGGYRKKSRDIQPSIEELKEDMRILHAMDIRVLRTYNVQLAHASNVLKAIKELKEEDSSFEMYVMLGAWIDCKNAWTDQPVDHYVESEKNSDEIDRAVALAREYPDIVKVIAVGNEAMVKWATSYFVQADVILKWVNHLQELKEQGQLPTDLWITSSDNFASWGGGDSEYHTDDLTELFKAVDYVSIHTYPMHDTHYNPDFWGVAEDMEGKSKEAQIQSAMKDALNYAVGQYQSVANYMQSLGISKPIHIGETGWASFSNGHYGDEGSKATDEYKEGLYYQLIREWSNQNNVSCFYFEAFDEIWKDAGNPGGSENHFGIFTIDGKAKYAIWDFVDKGKFEGLKRNGKPITKTFEGNKDVLMKGVLLPPVKEFSSINF